MSVSAAIIHAQLIINVTIHFAEYNCLVERSAESDKYVEGRDKYAETMINMPRGVTNMLRQ